MNNKDFNKKKVCFLSPKAAVIFLEKRNESFGGAEAALYCLAVELAKRKSLEISFIVADYKQNSLEKTNNIELHKSFSFKDNLFIKIWKFLRQLVLVNADIYVQRTRTPFSFWLALLCRFTGKKFVYMVALDSETRKTSKGILSSIGAFVFYLAMKLSNVVFVQHNSQLTELFSIGIRRNVFILPSAINIEKPLHLKKNTILWVGRAVPEKRPYKFIELAKNNPEHKFVMVLGGKTNSYYYEVSQKAKACSNLEFAGHVPFSKVDVFYQQAKILVNTAEIEGFPFSFVQALLNRVPVISLCAGVSDLLERHKCGFCCKDDFSVMQQKLELLLNDRNMFELYAENGNHFIKNNNNAEKVAEAFLNNILKGESSCAA